MLIIPDHQAPILPTQPLHLASMAVRGSKDSSILMPKSFWRCSGVGWGVVWWLRPILVFSYEDKLKHEDHLNYENNLKFEGNLNMKKILNMEMNSNRQNQTKSIIPNLNLPTISNKTYQTKPTKLNLPNQTYQT